MTTVAAHTPIVNFQDILDAMAQNPELKAEMRRHLQDEDFRNLPQTVAALAASLQELTAIVRDISLRQERTEGDIAELKDGQARLEAGQARLEAGQARLEAGQARLEAGQERTEGDIDELKDGQARLEAGQAQHTADIAELKAGQAQHTADIVDLRAVQDQMAETQTRMQGQLNRLTGSDYERKIARNLRRRAYRYFGINDAELAHSITLPNSSRIPDLLDAAYERGIITEGEVDQAQAVDIVISGIIPENQTAYAALEASITVDDHDVTRARDRASIISRAAGVPVMAGVVGVEIPDAVRQTAAANAVTAIVMLD